MSTRVVALDHVQLAMPDGGEETADRFYRDVLGFEVLAKPAPLAARGGRWYGRDGVAVHVGVDKDFHPAQKAHPAWRVEDLTALVRDLESAGVTPRWDEELPDVRRCYVDDPFGNRIELIDAPPPARPARPDSFDLSQLFVHLGLGARAETLPDFEWSEEYLRRYEAEHAGDGNEGRLVMIGREVATWDHWERHPAGDEVVVLLFGHCVLIQEIGGEHERFELGPGYGIINPRGVWHTVDVLQPGTALFITPGRGTEHRPR